MIFVFHTLYLLVKLAFKFYRKQKAIEGFKRIQQEHLSLQPKQDLLKDREDDIKFDPPVYRQRYSRVQIILLDHEWRRCIKKIVDFGCAELKFFQYLKNLYSVQKVLEVDIDQELLEENKYKVHPLTVDYLKERMEMFSVSIYAGSVSDPDETLNDVDAVICIELIEHLYPDTLEALPYNIFGFIKPRIAIFTTPNADFNILFPNFKGFRHPDHKFEWSRRQFIDWARNITLRFPEYSVKFEGVGEGPKGTESLGCCSQMAIFVKEFESISHEVPELFVGKDNVERESFGVCTYYSYSKQIESLRNLKELKQHGFYKFVEHIDYPYTPDNRTATEKILHEAMNIIYRHTTVYSRFFNEDTQCVEIPLYEICSNVDGQFVMEKELRQILVEAEFTVKECMLYGCDEPDLCVVQDINMDQQSSLSSNEDRTEQQVDHSLNCSNEAESDWESELKEPKKKTPPESTNVEPSEQLFDSGYQKSNPEWSPQSPLPDGLFEEHYKNFANDVNDINERVKLDFGLKAGNNKALMESKSPGCSHLKSPQSLPGTSEVFKRKKKKHPDDEESIKSEVKNIAHCIMYNSLNKLNIDDEIAPNEEIMALEAPEAPFIVENGDLANNNRDNEGNNYPEVPEPEPFFLDDEADEANENRVGFDIPEAGPADNQNQNLPHAVVPLVDYEDDEGIDIANETIEPEEIGLNHASREALFDPDSQLDMLEEYSLPDVTDDQSDEPVLFGVNLLPEENDAADDANPFPNWLLQLLGQQGEDDGINHDEPHFYCQGDGLGVHPSIIEVDVDESSSDTSSNDDAQAEAISEEDINPPLPTDAASGNIATLEVVGHAPDSFIPLHITQSLTSTDSTDEFFDTVDDSCPGTNIK